jgi:hypothetical protein
MVTIPKKTENNIIDRLQSIDPNRDVARIAVEKLTSIGDMVRFYEAYVEVIRANHWFFPETRAMEAIKEGLFRVYGTVERHTNENARKWQMVIEDNSRSQYFDLSDMPMLRITEDE